VDAAPAAVRELKKSYGRTTALQGITFALEPGRVTAFLGPNGAGKTTTLRVLTTLLRPDEGRAVVAGADRARAAGREVEVEVYEDAGHAFFADYRPTYRPEAAAGLWARAVGFLDAHLH
jgi:ABC-2 type transport system ATP-binding protein